MAYPRAPYRPAYEPLERGDARGVARSLLGLLAVVILAGAVGALTMFQATSEGPAKESLRRATAALTEIDTLLARHYDGLQARAEAAQPGEIMQVPDYPIAIGLTREDVLGVPQPQLRATILDRSADRLHEDGTGALRESTEGQGTLGLFSVAGFTDRALGMLTSSRHTAFGVVSAVLLVSATALILLTAAVFSGWSRLLAPGLILFGAGVAATAGALLVLLYARSASGSADEQLRAEMFGILEDIARLGFRSAIAFVVAGTLITVVAFAGRMIVGREAAPLSAD